MEAKLLLPGGAPVPFPRGILRRTKLKTLLLDIPCDVLRYTGPRSRCCFFSCRASCEFQAACFLPQTNVIRQPCCCASASHMLPNM